MDSRSVCGRPGGDPGKMRVEAGVGAGGSKVQMGRKDQIQQIQQVECTGSGVTGWKERRVVAYSGGPFLGL